MIFCNIFFFPLHVGAITSQRSNPGVDGGRRAGVSAEVLPADRHRPDRVRATRQGVGHCVIP